ncbi:sensor histidine kinase [Embleya sp. NPDC050493]|uniref:sensor histidine kinase n=1 Tax=Embleya sp. NPDC050493 TaxID=3363989 RepID=UPI00379D7751
MARTRGLTAPVRAGAKAVADAVRVLFVGAVTAVPTTLFLLGAGLVYAGALRSRPRRRVSRPITRGARALTDLERRRLAEPTSRTATRHDPPGPGAAHPDPAGPAPTEPGPIHSTPNDPRRLIRYLAARVPIGLLGGALLGLIGGGAGFAAVMVGAWLTGSPNTTTADVLILIPCGLALFALALYGLVGLADTDRALARRLLEPDRSEVLRRRVDELAASRAGVVEAVHEERRRIERDLHDGVQQRLVALGMLLGRARRGGDPARTDELLRQAHEQTQQALTDLRDVAWRIHPTGLDDGGLRAVLETIAERAPVRVALTYDVAVEPAPIVATAVYFVVAEAVTNTVKHARADAVTVCVLGAAGDPVRVRIVDDGVGGADAAGGGLSGLARRVAALDGTLRVDSPPGGPTTITAEVPCA